MPLNSLLILWMIINWYYINYIKKKNYENDDIDSQIEKMHIQLEKLRQTKKDLENENENLDYKINNLKKIIKRIQEEEDWILI